MNQRCAGCHQIIPPAISSSSRINLTNRLRTEMATIIESLSKERGYELVLDLGTSGIVTFSPAIDITEEVVKRYEQSKAAVPPVKK